MSRTEAGRWSALPPTRFSPADTLQRVEGNALHLVALALLLSLFATSARAHPIHTSYAEADYRPATATLEIAIRLFADDAEAALTRHAGKPISLATTPARELDALLLAYARARFTVTPREGASAVLAWVGRELREQSEHLWLYLQCPLPGGPAGARLRHGLLRETFSDQINSVRVRDHAREPVAQVTLLFLKDGEQTVAFAK